MKITKVCKITLPLALLASAYSVSAATIQTSTFAIGGSLRGPDSITSDSTSIYVEYSNGASATGAGGSSTIVRYGFDGSVLNSYSVPGSVDGLKFNTFSNQLWALQNQDGNSTVTVINPSNGAQTFLTYASTPANAITTAGNGFDDAVFTSATGAYLSRTNPRGDSNAATIVFSSLSGNILNLSPVLLYGAAPALMNDPDSLKQDQNGNLVLSSGDDGATIRVQNPGVSQIVTSFQLTDLSGAAVSGLDDTAFTNATNGTLLVTDTPNNVVQALYITGLTGTTEFASIGSLNSVGIVNQSTGAVTPIGSFASNAAPHGLLFFPNVNVTATPEPATALFTLGGLGAITLLRRRRK